MTTSKCRAFVSLAKIKTRCIEIYMEQRCWNESVLINALTLFQQGSTTEYNAFCAKYACPRIPEVFDGIQTVAQLQDALCYWYTYERDSDHGARCSGDLEWDTAMTYHLECVSKWCEVRQAESAAAVVGTGAR